MGTSQMMHLSRAQGDMLKGGERTFGAAGAVEGNPVGGGGRGGDPILLSQLAQTVGPVGGKAVGDDVGVGDSRSLQSCTHLRLGAVKQRRTCLTCARMPAQLSRQNAQHAGTQVVKVHASSSSFFFFLFLVDACSALHIEEVTDALSVGLPALQETGG